MTNSAELISPILYRNVLKCPLRSQVSKVKARMFQEYPMQKVSKQSEIEQKSNMIQSFLNKQAIDKLVPERDAEIERISYLIRQL